MKIARLYIISLLFMIFLFVILPVFVCPAQTEKPRMTVGYTVTSLPGADIRDATAALNIWIKEFGNREGFQSQASLYEDVDSLIRDFTNRKLDMAFLRTHEYFSVIRKINAEPAVVKTRLGKATLKYILLVSSNSQNIQIRDLKNLRLSILKNDDLGMMFLNTKLLKAKLPEAGQFFGNIQVKGKESQVLLSVFFGQADACITTDTSFKTMVELNPQIGHKIRIISASQELIDMVSFVQKDFDQQFKERIIRSTGKIIETERGRQMLLLFK
jgi:ABC-type phosphate/phosphonate transport system substrate-binding protein